MKKIILFSVLVIVILGAITLASLIQNTVTVVINTTSGATNYVEYSLTELSNGLTEENITFSDSNPTFTRYFKIPKYSNITVANISITSPHETELKETGEIIELDTTGVLYYGLTANSTHFLLTDGTNISLYDNTGNLINTNLLNQSGYGSARFLSANKTHLFVTHFSLGATKGMNTSIHFHNGTFVGEILLGTASQRVTRGIEENGSHYFIAEDDTGGYGNANLTIYTKDGTEISSININSSMSGNGYVSGGVVVRNNLIWVCNDNEYNATTGNLTDVIYKWYTNGTYIKKFVKDRRTCYDFTIQGDYMYMNDYNTSKAVTDDGYNKLVEYFINDTYVSNVSIDAGDDGNIDYNHTAIFSTGETDIVDLNLTELNNYLLTCTSDSNGNCDVPFNITASNGIVKVSDINITYNYNTSYLFTRNDTYTWNDTTDLTPNNKQKRRYKIQPTSNLLSNALNITGYYLRNWTADECEINNTAYTITSNYCAISTNLTQGQYWSTHYIWDNNITTEVAVNMTNTSWTSSDKLYQNFTLTYFDPDLTSGTSGLFTNVTYSWTYNSTIAQGEKLEYWDGSSWSDITPSNTCPTYEQQTVGSRVFYTCLNTSDNYVSIKIESSN